MTRLALGAKWATRGASGFFAVALIVFADRAGVSIEFNATAPSPTPHWRKNQRRLTSFRTSCLISFSKFIANFSKWFRRGSAGHGQRLSTRLPGWALSRQATVL